MSSLYRLHSTIPDFQYADRTFSDAHVNWFVTEREIPVIPYEEGIHDYRKKSDTEFEELALNEHFTYGEANALGTYLFEENKIECVIEEAQLPVCKCCVTCYHCDIGYDGEGYIDLYERSGYNLSFKVKGYFVVRGLWAEPMNSEEQLMAFRECWN